MEPGTPTPGETATPGSLSNDGQTAATTPVPSTPVVNATDPAEVERLRKDKEQALMRANQLENELKKRTDAEAADRQKRLEEKEEFKTLYEQTQARLKEIEDQQTAQATRDALAAATTDVYKDYPANVVDLAQTAGLALTEDSDEARAALKAKLDTFKAKVGGGAPTATSNNPSAPAPTNIDRAELVRRDHPGAESPMALASARGDDSVTRKFISGLPAIERMKEMAQRGY